jgi:hypothetical protein
MTFLADLLASRKPQVETEVSEESHHTPAGNGGFGDTLTIDADNPLVAKLADALGLSDDWKLKKINNGLHAAYSSDDRLTFFAHPDDFEPEDMEDDEDHDMFKDAEDRMGQ